MNIPCAAMQRCVAVVFKDVVGKLGNWNRMLKVDVSDGTDMVVVRLPCAYAVAGADVGHRGTAQGESLGSIGLGT